MTQIVRLIGLSIAVAAIGIYFQGLSKGLCAGGFIFGAGLVMDSLKK